MEKPDNNSNSKFMFRLMLVFVCLLWFSNLLLIFIEKKTDTGFDKGTFGDMFGAVNALFSGLAFAGLIYTAMMQREELELQRKELGLNREELELTRKEFERMASTQELSEQALKKQAQAYIYSAIINGHNSRVVQLNKEIDELRKRYLNEVTNGFGGHNTNLEIEQKKRELEILLKIIADFLRKLHELES